MPQMSPEQMELCEERVTDCLKMLRYLSGLQSRHSSSSPGSQIISKQELESYLQQENFSESFKEQFTKEIRKFSSRGTTQTELVQVTEAVKRILWPALLDIIKSGDTELKDQLYTDGYKHLGDNSYSIPLDDLKAQIPFIASVEDEYITYTLEVACQNNLLKFDVNIGTRTKVYWTQVCEQSGVSAAISGVGDMTSSLFNQCRNPSQYIDRDNAVSATRSGAVGQRAPITRRAAAMKRSATVADKGSGTGIGCW